MRMWPRPLSSITIATESLPQCVRVYERETYTHRGSCMRERERESIRRFGICGESWRTTTEQLGFGGVKYIPYKQLREEGRSLNLVV